MAAEMVLRDIDPTPAAYTNKRNVAVEPVIMDNKDVSATEDARQGVHKKDVLLSFTLD